MDIIIDWAAITMAVVASCLRFLWVIDAKVEKFEKTSEGWDWKKYIRGRWMRWVLHLGFAGVFTIYIPNAIIWCIKNDHEYIAGTLEIGGPFLVGFYAYKLITWIEHKVKKKTKQDEA